MAKRTDMGEKRRRACVLYVRNGLQQQEIAGIVGVSQKTISGWKAQDNWDKQKVAFTTTKPMELARLYAQLGALNNAIEQREQKYPTASEADAQNKLASAIKKLEDETGLSATVNAFIAFHDWLSKRNLDKAKEVAELHDLYIKHIAS